MGETGAHPTEQTMFAELVQQVETAAPARSIYTRERADIRYHHAKIGIGVERLGILIGRAVDARADASADELRRRTRSTASRSLQQAFRRSALPGSNVHR